MLLPPNSEALTPIQSFYLNPKILNHPLGRRKNKLKTSTKNAPQASAVTAASKITFFRLRMVQGEEKRAGAGGSGYRRFGCYVSEPPVYSNTSPCRSVEIICLQSVHGFRTRLTIPRLRSAMRFLNFCFPNMAIYFPKCIIRQIPNPTLKCNG